MKRKLFCLIFSILLTLSIPGAAYAALSDEDLSEWSFEELVAAREAIELEIRNRLNIEDDGELLPNGVYVVGEDIFPGKFVIKNTGDRPIQWETYLSKKDYDDHSFNDWDMLYKNASCLVKLEDGMILEIKLGNGSRIYNVDGIIGE